MCWSSVDDVITLVKKGLRAFKTLNTFTDTVAKINSQIPDKEPGGGAADGVCSTCYSHTTPSVLYIFSPEPYKCINAKDISKFLFTVGHLLQKIDQPV